MADVFASNGRGRVAVIDSPGPSMSLFLEGWGGSIGFKSLIMQMRVQQQGGVQFLHTLRDFIYIYVFGDRISAMQISGVSYWRQCDAPGAHGIEYVNGYYLDNRVSERATPVTCVLGVGTPFFGFLTGFNFDYNDPENQLAQFSLNFHVVPEASSFG